MARITGEIGNICRKISGQAQRSYFVREAKSPKVLHCPSLRRIGLRIEGGAWLLIDQNGPDLTPTQFIRQHQPAGATADDEHGTDAWRSLNQCVARHAASRPESLASFYGLPVASPSREFTLLNLRAI